MFFQATGSADIAVETVFKHPYSNYSASRMSTVLWAVMQCVHSSSMCPSSVAARAVVYVCSLQFVAHMFWISRGMNDMQVQSVEMDVTATSHVGVLAHVGSMLALYYSQVCFDSLSPPV